MAIELTLLFIVSIIMATLMERYKEVCELQETRRSRNERMNRDAVRLRNIFVPVDTERLKSLKVS